MPTRMLREGILSSDKVDTLNSDEEVFYRRLMSIVDDFGRSEADPRLLRAACFPLRVERISTDSINKWLSACQHAGLVTVYTVSGKTYLQLENLGKPRSEKSKYPGPPNTHLNTSVTPVTDVPYTNPNSVSVSSSYSSSLPCSVSEANGGGAAAKQSKPSAEPCETPCADADAIAWTLASDLAKAHATFQPGRLHDARALIERLLASATDPVIQANAIRESHRLYCLHWAKMRSQKPNAFVPQLPRWFSDGDYLQPPPEPTVGTGGADW